MTRKVVQISTSDGTFAVCEDGSVWCFAKTGDQWLQLPPIQQEDEPAPAAVRAGPVTDEEVKQAILTWTAAPGDMTDWWTTVLTDFIARRGISTEPAEFTDEQVDAATRRWFKYGPENVETFRDDMRAALRAGGARP